MHHDERLDRQVQAGLYADGQRITLSGEIDEQVKQGCLRIIEIDTLTVWYHAREGDSREVSFPGLRGALEDLEAKQGDAFDALALE